MAASLRARMVAQAGNRCGYCRAHQQYVYETLHIEHIEPRARGGSNDEANLWLACALCNRAKRDQTHGRDPVTRRWVRLFNPRR
jgi:5-methylcytosine-specific restriction endonuclease McrA